MRQSRLATCLQHRRSCTDHHCQHLRLIGHQHLRLTPIIGLPPAGVAAIAAGDADAAIPTTVTVDRVRLTRLPRLKLIQIQVLGQPSQSQDPSPRLRPPSQTQEPGNSSLRNRSRGSHHLRRSKSQKTKRGEPSRLNLLRRNIRGCKPRSRQWQRDIVVLRVMIIPCPSVPNFQSQVLQAKAEP